MANITKPTLYYIKHPLADNTLTDQALAVFSDEDVAEYRSEYDEYLNAQHQAVKDMSILCNECTSYIKAIFGQDYDGKQIRYFERNIRNGENFVDKHASRYPNPNHIEAKVGDARKKYCAFMSQDNAPKIGGEDTLKEINNAVSFLLKRGMSLNTDFTVSNAVNIAKTIASQDFDDEVVVAGDKGTALIQHNVLMSSGKPFPTSSFRCVAEGANKLGIECIDISKSYEDFDEEVQTLINDGANYAVSFLDSDQPTFTVC